jgi:hypothetical protein
MRTMAVLLLLAGCAGPVRVATAEPDVPSPPRAWDAMTHDNKVGWMAREVLPRMSAEFQDHDEERFADFSCATCHGPEPASRNFEMPSLSLPALPPTGSPEQQQMVREYQPMLQFMFNRVLPTMQTLTGQPEFEPGHPEGFSCYSCHPHMGDEGSTPIRLTMAPQNEPPPEAVAPVE